EFGYALDYPDALVIWEAQFGDFLNGAQVIVDQFMTSSEDKWHRLSGLVLYLPHGYEGQGPEHSSARLERFLTLSAQDNIEVCNVTTPAQYFHLLRRHMKKGIRRPLIIMSPKSLLRLPAARSAKAEFINGAFQEIIDDATVLDKQNVKRIILTSGKVYYELLSYKNEHNRDDTAIVRLEQFYPYDGNMIANVLKSYANADTVVWVQEEPKNMGAWNFLHWRLLEDKRADQKLCYAGRPESASPAVGSSKIAADQQKKLIEDGFNI
ncbi:MAG: multifunctional oxoglutarate decarboxylase/oxoglutarate dehydrogenase thiamine pyrophosphate-binding subunit/dihydrolipoyllysine-residue succinyltransferase subunit, partial [Ignavibacteriales bacterium]|nr:multifunctional oxoglutarate decarboxylase/oxoglutarate dehydrogenase thiamine pyrophosphate-binding subunit/dihydrolipoyllysine-residue succinyltransferase subunit [Ignavibacteriales bacterium]